MNRTLAKWSLRYDAAGDRGRWAIEELRLHFGERVATPGALKMFFVHKCTDNWRSYELQLNARPRAPRPRRRGGSSFLVCWTRETRLLVEKWHLAKYQNIVYERNDENPGFQYVWSRTT
ncbi:hypothetical protein PsorP6_002090 [Peronosclerospora sorghi]|uniref:Uncharacterized protein n=1 Tax=Peronosclerospora sorghi TaxID=230839 RepID=A0ACC0WRW8_9STRA|nr:hypothetical protein PsorP6_002090 [Peronosclerospora sorghi]